MFRGRIVYSGKVPHCGNSLNALLLSMSAACLLVSCRFGYERLPDEVDLGSGGTGAAIGGALTGSGGDGAATGGAAPGGGGAGGSVGGSSGASSGGSSVGGSSGASAGGGASGGSGSGTGGAGGTPTGGTGGEATGGESTGGAASGGAASGGAASGGAGGGGGGAVPTADFTRSPGVGDTITSFAFDASASSDPEDGASLLREWDYESDGVFDQSGVTANHSYPSAGTYTVTLRVTDSDGNTATKTNNVIVASAGSLLVVTTGTDENDGSANPTLSLREAIDVSNGTAGRQTIVLSSGITARPISNLPIITDGVDIVGDGGAIDGTGMGANRNCLNSQSTGTRFLALEIYGCARHAIQIQNGDDNEVRGCYIHDLAGGGIFTAASTGHVIEANEIGFAAEFGVSINSGTTDVIANYIHDTSLIGIDLGGGATGARLIGNRSIGGSIGIQVGAATVKVWFNTVIGAAQSALQVSTGPSDVRNNIFAFAGTYGTLGAQGNFVPLDYNLVFGNGSGACNNCTHGAHSVFADPSFVLPASPLFRPQQGGPASNAGVDVGFGRDGTPGAAYSGGAPDLGYIEIE